MTLPTGTVTLLLTDVESSARAWEADPEMMAAEIAHHYEALDAAISRHGGTRPQEQGEGDSVVGAFARASDAVTAAVDAQAALAKETKLPVRMAIHTGEVEMRDDKNYAGPTACVAKLRTVKS